MTNTSCVQNQLQEQVQRLTNIELEALSRIYQDMSYVFGVLVEYKALKDSRCDNQILLNVYRNRCIVQLNLSNTINVDDYLTLQSNRMEQRYSSFKENAQNVFSTLKNNLQQEFSEVFNDEEIQQFFLSYEQNNLSKKPHFHQLQGQKVDLNINFNNEVLSKIISSLNQQDQQRQQLLLQYQQNSNILQEITSPEQLSQQVKLRYSLAIQKLKEMQIQPQNKTEKIDEEFPNMENANIQENNQNQQILLLKESLQKYDQLLVLFGVIHEYYSNQSEEAQMKRQSLINKINYLLISLLQQRGNLENNEMNYIFLMKLLTRSKIYNQNHKLF